MKSLTPLEKTLFKILGFIIFGVVAWYVAHVEGINKSQWQKMSTIEKRINEYHAEK